MNDAPPFLTNAYYYLKWLFSNGFSDDTFVNEVESLFLNNSNRVVCLSTNNSKSVVDVFIKQASHHLKPFYYFTQLQRLQFDSTNNLFIQIGAESITGSALLEHALAIQGEKIVIIDNGIHFLSDTLWGHQMRDKLLGILSGESVTGLTLILTGSSKDIIAFRSKYPDIAKKLVSLSYHLVQAPDDRGLFRRGQQVCILPFLRAYYPTQKENIVWEQNSWTPIDDSGCVRFLRADQSLNFIKAKFPKNPSKEILALAINNALKSWLIPVDEQQLDHLHILDRRVEAIRILTTGSKVWSSNEARKPELFPDIVRNNVNGLDPVHTPENDRAGLTRYLCEEWFISDSGVLEYGKNSLDVCDIHNLDALTSKLNDNKDLLSQYIFSRLPPFMQYLLKDRLSLLLPDSLLATGLVSELNSLINKDSFYEKNLLANLQLSEHTKKLLTANPEQTDFRYFNRLLLEDIYSNELIRHREANYDLSNWGPSTSRIPYRLHNEPRRLMLGAALQSRAIYLLKANSSEEDIPIKTANCDGWYPPGKKLRAMFSTFAGLTHEDAIVISERAAKKLTRWYTLNWNLLIPGTVSKVELLVKQNESIKKGELMARAFIDLYALGLRRYEAVQFARAWNQPTIDGWLEIGLPNALAPIDARILEIRRHKITDIQQMDDEFEFADRVLNSHLISGNFQRWNEIITIVLQIVSEISVGDKLSTRHGIKGIVSKVLKDDDPKLQLDGQQAEIVLSPIGIARRGAMGQFRESLQEKDKEADENRLPHSGLIFVMRQPQDAVWRFRVCGTENKGVKGQRYGEMEFWALMAHGASAIAQELLSLNRTTSSWMQWEAITSTLFRSEHLLNVSELASKLRESQDSLSKYLMAQFETETRRQLKRLNNTSVQLVTIQQKLIDKLNQIIMGGMLFDKNTFKHINLSEEVHYIVKQNPKGAELVHLNRLLLEEAYPNLFVKVSKDHHQLASQAINRYLAMFDAKIEDSQILDSSVEGFKILCSNDSEVRNALDLLESRETFALKGGLGVINLPVSMNISIAKINRAISHVFVLPPWLRPISSFGLHPLTKAYTYLIIKLKQYYTKSSDASQNKLLFELKDAVESCVNIISEEIHGAQDSTSGFLRREVLGRRLTRSARGVIVPRPYLRIDEVEIPGCVADELFNGLSEEKRKYVLVNRNPTLHKLGLLAMRTRISELNEPVIGLPLGVLKVLGADFDGDQVSIVALETEAALSEAENLLPGSNNLRVDPFRINLSNEASPTELPIFPLLHELSSIKDEQEIIKLGSNYSQEEWCELHKQRLSVLLDAVEGWPDKIMDELLIKYLDLWHGLEEDIWLEKANEKMDLIYKAARKKGRIGGVLRRELYRRKFTDNKSFQNSISALQAVTERLVQSVLSTKTGQGATNFDAVEYFTRPDSKAAQESLKLLEEDSVFSFDCNRLADALKSGRQEPSGLLAWLAKPSLENLLYALPQSRILTTRQLNINLENISIDIAEITVELTALEKGIGQVIGCEKFDFSQSKAIVDKIRNLSVRLLKNQQNLKESAAKWKRVLQEGCMDINEAMNLTINLNQISQKANLDRENSIKMLQKFLAFFQNLTINNQKASRLKIYLEEVITAQKHAQISIDNIDNLFQAENSLKEQQHNVGFDPRISWFVS